MNPTNETLALMKAAQTNPNDAITKSVTTGTGLIGYDLQAPAKNLYPVLTPTRNLIPRVSGETGVATNWRVVQAIAGSGFDAMAWVPEGQRSGRMSYTTATKAANYVTIGEEDQVSFESVTAARGFEDIKATAAIRLLQKMMLKEEIAIFAGNTSVSLGTPTAPTVTSASTGGSIAAATYNVYVVALTLEGRQNSSVTGGVATTLTITGGDGLTYTLNGGSSNKSAATSSGALSGSTNVINASTPAIRGAVAYAWYVGTSGSETLQAITTINSVSLSSLSTGNQNASAVTSDHSANGSGTVPAFDGLLYSAFNSASNAYYNALATGTAGTGTPLTSSGRGSVNEIDVMCQSLWDNYRVSPTHLFMNSQELKNLTNKVLSNASGPLLRYNSNGDDYQVTASGTIDFYFNPFSATGGSKIKIVLHPYMAPGTILAYADDLPAQYKSNHVPNVAEVKTRRDYYEIDWPQRTRQYEMGVYAEEVLAVYAPFTMGVLTNIANG